MTPADHLAPRQQRSRETLAKLLKATIETLEVHGLEGATIPRIAAAAGVAQASVYRRFRDRDALLRAALLAGLETGREGTRTQLRPEAFEGRTLEWVVRALVAAIMRQYQEHPRLMQALVRFVERDTDEEFKAKTLALVAGNLEAAVELLLAFTRRIGHRDPRRAVTFALLLVTSAIEMRALDEPSMWRVLLPLSDEQILDEMVAAVLAYLQTPQP